MGSIFSCKLNPCCGNRLNCNPPEQFVRPVAPPRTPKSIKEIGERFVEVREKALGYKAAIERESPEEWDLEQRVFQAANDPKLPEATRTLISELWREFVNREPPEEEDAKESILAELGSRSLLNGVDEDLWDEIAQAVLEAATIKLEG